MGFIEDPDRDFSYNTQQQVNFLDRYLGITYYFIGGAILLYVGVYDLYMEKSYFELEASRGISVTHVSGDAFVHSSGKVATRYFSPEEISVPGLENGNVFVATKIHIANQHRGVCEDLTMRCLSSSDCSKDVDSTCSEDGYCVEPSWCNDGSQPEVYDLPTSDYLLWVKSAIQYIQLDDQKLFHSDMTRPIMWPDAGHNTYKVKDLLQMTEPMPIRYEEVSELGAALEVQLHYDCNINLPTSHCGDPLIKVRRLDSVFDAENIGFRIKHGRPLAEPDTRELFDMRGLRFYFRTVGTGRKVDEIAIAMKLSTALALLSIANVITDFLLLNIFRSKEKYKARKIMESEDFSDAFAQRPEETLETSGDFAEPKEATDDVNAMEEMEGEDEDDSLEMPWLKALRH